MAAKLYVRMSLLEKAGQRKPSNLVGQQTTYGGKRIDTRRCCPRIAWVRHERDRSALLQVDDRVLHAFVGPHDDQRLLADGPADLVVLGHDDLLGRDLALVRLRSNELLRRFQDTMTAHQ
jgi:hypothetical protein